MKRQKAFKELDGFKIFVLYSDGQIGEYQSEANAISEINQNDGAGSSVKKVLVGKELSMVTEQCKQVKCFDTKKLGKTGCLKP